MREFELHHVYVVWLGLPIIRGPTQNGSFRKVDRLLRALTRKHPKTSAYIDDFAIFATKQGRYTDYVRDPHGQLVLVRASDGVHYTAAGGDLVARAVLLQLGRVYRLER
jgi:hypothetical protein